MLPETVSALSVPTEVIFVWAAVKIVPERPLVPVTTPTALIPPARTLIPVLAVIIPKESIFVTSSYVKVPPIDTLPLNVPSTAVTFPDTTLFPVIETPVFVVSKRFVLS